MTSQLSSRYYRVQPVYLFNCFMHEKLIVRAWVILSLRLIPGEFNQDLKFSLLNSGIS